MGVATMANARAVCPCQTIRSTLNRVFRRYRLAYKLLRCLEVEIWRFRANEQLPCARARGINVRLHPRSAHARMRTFLEQELSVRFCR